MTEQVKHTHGPYRVEKAMVYGGDGVMICNCLGSTRRNAVADAERIRLALACLDPLLAACEKAEAAGEMLIDQFSKDGTFAHMRPYVDALVTPMALLRGAIALAKGEADD